MIMRAQMFINLVLEGLLREHLMVAPLLVTIAITEHLVTMGAEDFRVKYLGTSRDILFVSLFVIYQ